jgi:hypothetical protein
MKGARYLPTRNLRGPERNYVIFSKLQNRAAQAVCHKIVKCVVSGKAMSNIAQDSALPANTRQPEVIPLRRTH